MARLFPRTLREVVAKAARPIMKKRGFAESSILLDWPSIVGTELSQHAHPIKIQFPRGESTGGTLTVRCTPAFAPELQLLTPIVLDKLSMHIGYRAIDRIVIEQHHAAMQPKAQATKHTQHSTTDDATLSDDPVVNALLRLEKIRKLKDDNKTKPQ